MSYGGGGKWSIQGQRDPGQQRPDPKWLSPMGPGSQSPGPGPKAQAHSSRPRPRGPRPTVPRPTWPRPLVPPAADAGPMGPGQWPSLVSPRCPAQPSQPRGQGIRQMPKDKSRNSTVNSMIFKELIKISFKTL